MKAPTNGDTWLELKGSFKGATCHEIGCSSKGNSGTKCGNCVGSGDVISKNYSQLIKVLEVSNETN